MAEQEEAVKIVVEVVDKFSKPLGDLRKQLTPIGDKTSEGASTLQKHFHALRQSVVNVGSALNITLAPALRALGLGFAGVAGAVLAVVTAIKGLAGNIETLSRLSHETGLNVDRMRELEAVMRRFSVPLGEMRASWREFAGEMHKARIGTSEVLVNLRQHGLGGFATQLRGAKTTAEALEATLKELDRIANPRERRLFLEIMKLPPGLADASREERERLAKEYRDTVGPTNKEDVDASKAFQDSIWRMENAWDKLTKQLAREGTLDDITKSLETVAGSIERMNTEIGGAPTVTIRPGSIADKILGPRAGEWHAPKSPGRPLTIWEQLFGMGLLTVDSEHPAAPSEEKAKEPIKKGTSEGVVEGLKKMALDMGGGEGMFGGAAVIRASLGGGGRGGRGGDGDGDGTGEAEPMGALTGLDRSRFAEELARKPWLKDKILGIAAGENKDPKANLAVIESMMNRAMVRGTTLEQAAKLAHEHGGYYAGYRPGDLRNPRIRAMIERNLEAALKGSNVSNYATDNASGGLAARERRSGKFRLQKEYGGESFFSPGTGGRGAAGRERYEQWRKHADPPPPIPREKLDEGQPDQPPKTEGGAALRVELNGFPRGTHTSTEASGVFSSVETHRGGPLSERA